MKTKDILIAVGFFIAPLGFFAAGVYYGPKIKKWYSDKKVPRDEVKIKKEEDGKV